MDKMNEHHRLTQAWAGVVNNKHSVVNDTLSNL